MSVRLKYVGASTRYFDSVAGSREQWTPGRVSDVADAAAVALIQTGFFAAVAGEEMRYTAAQLTALAAAGGLTPWASYAETDSGELLDAYSPTRLVPRSQAYSLPRASSDPLTNYNNIMNAITAAGVGATLVAPYGQTYLLGHEINPLSGQTLRWHGSKLKLPNQVSSALTATAAVSSATGNQLLSVQVASTTGFYVTQRVTLEDNTVGGVRTMMTRSGTVESISTGTVAVRFENGIGSNMTVTSNTTTFIETANTSFTFPVGAVLASISCMFKTDETNSGIVLLDAEVDGNASNNPYGRRWEIAPAIWLRSTASRIADLWLHDTAVDAVVHAANGLMADTIRIDKPGCMGFHIGAASAGIYGGQKTILNNIWVDTPGISTPCSGHYGGYGSAHPAYPGIGFSQLNHEVLVSGAHLTNDYGVAGTTWGQAIGCLGNGDVYAVEFADVFIKDFNKGIGAIQMARTTSSASVITDPAGDINKAGQRLQFTQVHVDNCGPLDTTSLKPWECCSIGRNAGTPPLVNRVLVADCDFTDSPLYVQDVNMTFSGRNEFVATDVTKSSSLILLGSVAGNYADISGVISRRPVSSSELSYEGYTTNIFVNGTYAVRGDNVTVTGGTRGLTAHSGADVQVSNFKAADQWYWGALAKAANTKLVLNSPHIRLTSAASSSYVGIDAGGGGGVLGTGGTLTVTNPDIDLVTTNAAQYGVRLSTTSSATIPRQQVVGGRVRVSGTSTTPIQSGGASSLAVVKGVLLSHTFTPGAAETADANLVSVNA